MDDPLLLINDIFDDIARLWQWLRGFKRGQATSGHIFIGGAVVAKIRDDQAYPFSVEWLDAEGAETTQLPEGSGVVAVVDNQQLATVAMSDSSHGTVQAVAGWDQQPSPIFHITVTAGNLAATSEDIEIDPTVAVSERIVIQGTA